MADSSIWESGTQGPPGPPGAKVLLRTTATHIQYSYEGEGIWYNLVALSLLIGPAGESIVGPQGPEGPAGQSIAGPVGPQGIQGIQGVPGTPGSVIHSGTGVPDISLGVEGDYYLDDSSALFYGPKDEFGWGADPLDLRGGASGVHFGTRAISNNTSAFAKTAAIDPTLVSNSDYTQITAIFDAIPSGALRGITQQANSMTIARTGPYKIELWASMFTSVNNTDLAFKFAVNGSISLVRRPRTRLDVAGQFSSVAAFGLVDLVAGDVVTLWIASTTTCNVTISDAVFALNELR